MNLTELNKIATRMVAPGKGILAADESYRHHQETLRRDRRRIRRPTADATIASLLFRSNEAMSKYVSGVILYDETIRQKAKDGTSLVKLIEQAGSIPGIKVDKGIEASAWLSGRAHHRRPRRSARTLHRISRVRRPIRQVARGDRHRTRNSELHLRVDQCARARPLRGAVPGTGHCADRRAGSADGRRPRHGPLLSGYGIRAQAKCSSSSTIRRSRSKAWC